ncbi:CASC3/Barentsz eIF4AIII binding domain-containing protein [Phthorimaea operculella]|nr:CASC3/Barentsz eIF4AIII binding domain-containing protein [Phthorimaea operculella]
MTTLARRREHDSGDYSDASHHENDQDTSGNGAVNDESDYDSAASDSEPSERDPESQETERRVDDDEDRSNPQYIPKRGTFYEHDDRTADNGGEESANARDGASETASEKKEGETPAERRRGPRKSESVNKWSHDKYNENEQEGETPAERRRGPRKSESVNKWSHDKYNENEQAPKSRDELVAIYGYDIRNEDAPPHARRNRRYGRGPNKYTRTWEDEEAYKRQANAAVPPRKPPNPEDFPELESGGRGKRAPRPRSKSQPSSTESIENGNLRRNASIKDRARGRRPLPRTPKENKKEYKEREGQKENREKLPPLENLTITATVVNNSQSQPARKVNATVAQQRPVPTEQGKKKPPPPAPQQQPQPTAAPNKSPPQSTQPQKPQQPNREQTQPQEPRGSKRYSSLRQRPLDTYSPPQQQQSQQTQQQQRYHGDFPAGNQHQGSPAPQQVPHPQQLMQQMRNAQVRLGILEQQQMVTHPHHNIQHMPPQVPQHSIAQLQQTQAYAPPAMMPAQYMQQIQGAAMYAAPPPAPYPHQLYQHHNYVNAVSIAETPHNYVQPAGGVTYYSCAEQETLPRAQRRPTAAIPIVKPAAPERPANSSEKDNIDRIVENMFVRKPWPNNAAGVEKDNIDRNVENMFVRKPWPNNAAGVGKCIYRLFCTVYLILVNSSEKDNIDRNVENMFVRKPWPNNAAGVEKDNIDRNVENMFVRKPWPNNAAGVGKCIYRLFCTVYLILVNSSEKDNIDRNVENMFVRKPWPNNAAGVDSKEKSEPRSSQEPQSKESSQPNSLTSSSISTDSKPSESIEREVPEKEKEIKEVKEVQKEVESVPEVEKEVQKESEQKEQESISTDA